MTDQLQRSQSETPFYNLESDKEYRAHNLSDDQKKWLGLWFGLSILLIVVPGVLGLFFGSAFNFLSYFALFTMAIGSFGFYKDEDGLGFRNIQAKIENRKMEHDKNADGSIAKAKRPPIGLRAVGYPTENTIPEFPEEIREAMDESQLQNIMQQFNEDVFTLGTIYSKEDNSDTAFVVGTGMRGSNADSIGSFMARKRVVDALTHVAIESDSYPSFSLIYSTRPRDMIPIMTWYDDNLDPEVTNAPSIELKDKGIKDGIPVLDEESFFKGSLKERQATSINMMTAKATLDGQEGSMAIGITVPRPSNWRRRKDGTLDGLLTPKQLQDAPITNLALLLEQELDSAGVSDVAALSETDINRFIRSKWDVKNIRPWLSSVAAHAATEVARLYGNEQQPQLDYEPQPAPSPWPERKIVAGKTKNGKSFLFIDGTYHRVLQVRKFGKTKIFADDFLPLFMSQDIQPASMTGLTVSVCGDIVDVESEQKMLTRRIVIRRAINNEKKGIRYQTPTDLEKEGSLENKQFMLHHGGAFAFSYNVYVTISAITPDLLDGVEKRVRTHARECRIKLRYITDESRQLRAFATANFGVNMANK
jgi:hypothetical protein